MRKEDEIIVVAPVAEIFTTPELQIEGLITCPDKVKAIVENYAASARHMRRGSTKEELQEGVENAERNYDFKQIIPYTVLIQEGQVFVYKRLSGGGEARLHGKLSIGVGGHMNVLFNKENVYEVLRDEANRELEEELAIHYSNPLDGLKTTVVGLINDNSEDVSRVHLGFLIKAEVPSNALVAVREVDQLEGEWMTVEELRKPENFDRLESWSKIALEAL